jgi:hypothetical protein
MNGVATSEQRLTSQYGRVFDSVPPPCDTCILVEKCRDSSQSCAAFRMYAELRPWQAKHVGSNLR